jgi:hypothetical protein
MRMLFPSKYTVQLLSGLGMTHSFEHHLQDSNVRVIGMSALRNLSVYSAAWEADPMKVLVCVPEVKT